MSQQQDKFNLHMVTEMAMVKVLRAMSSFCSLYQHQTHGFTPVVVSDFSGERESLILCDQETMNKLVTIEVLPTQTGEMKAFFFGSQAFNDLQPVFSANIFSDAAFPAHAHSVQGQVGDAEIGYTLRDFSQRALDFASFVWENKKVNNTELKESLS